jgi:hypothetical protein
MRLGRFPTHLARDFTLQSFETGIPFYPSASESKVESAAPVRAVKMNWNGRENGTLTRVSSLDHVTVIMVPDFRTGSTYRPKRPSQKR